jgi:DNA-directed RNA polymerase specialized sigma24 family protein
MGKLEALRFLNAADLFRQTGIFFWHDCLRRAGRHYAPARAVYATAHCLQACADEPLPAQASARPVRHIVHTLLQRHLPAVDNIILPPDVDSWGPAETQWWSARTYLGHLMSVQCGPYMLKNTWRRLSDHGISVDYLELNDLAALFANDHLSHAMRWFDPARGEGKEAPWITTVFFRFALPRVVSLRQSRVSFDLTFELADDSLTPERLLESRARQHLLERLRDQLARLPSVQQHALQHYFGFDEPECTLAEVASRLGCSLHFARLAVTSGLGALAGTLHADHLLEPDEVELARLLFAEGRDARSAAAVLGISTAEVHRRSKRLGAALRSALRARTTSAKSRTTPSSREPAVFSEMTTDLTHPVDIEARIERVVEALERHVQMRREEPRTADRLGLPVRLTGPDHDRVVQLRGSHKDWLTQCQLRPFQAALGVRVDLYWRLEAAVHALQDDTLLASFFAPQGAQLEAPGRRTDLPGDQGAWTALLDAALARHTVVAETVLRSWQDSQDVGTLPEEEQLGLIERVLASLAATAEALDGEMPWGDRVRGEAFLALWPSSEDDDAVLCGWLGAGDAPLATIRLAEVLSRQLSMVGGLDDASAASLADSAALQLLYGEVPLPGFQRGPADADGRQLLVWQTPSMDVRQAELTAQAS